MPPAKAKKGKRKDPNGIETTLPLAVLQDKFATAEKLLHDAQVSPRPGLDKVLAKALWMSCALKRYEIAKLLLEKGVDADASIGSDSTPLMTAGSKDIVELLVAHNANVNATDTWGKTALMCAKNADIALALLRHQAAIDEKDYDGKTALMHAVCSYGTSELAHCLIENGADVRICDSQGRTVLITAAWKSQVSIIKEAISRG